MIVSFYDRNFKALQNNASLVIDKDSYILKKRPIEMNSLSCICEQFTERIQPTFLIIKDDKGKYIYGSLAGVPLITEDNKTEINATDIKSILSSDVLLNNGSFETVKQVLNYIFNEWDKQVNQNSFNCELIYNINKPDIILSGLVPEYNNDKFNAWEQMQAYLKYYDLYMDTHIDIINKKVQFIVGETMLNNLEIKLWEYGIRNYGKQINEINECQGYYQDENKNIYPVKDTSGEDIKWILTSQNKITTNIELRDIYPIKRKIFISNESGQQASAEALKYLLESLYSENINLNVKDVQPTFETNFIVYDEEGKDLYKELPCGELVYDEHGLIKFQIGYRFIGAEFI